MKKRTLAGGGNLNEIQNQLAHFHQRRPLREIVYQYLKENILSGRYHQGERLLEVEIAMELNISRTPVREALRKLEQEGLVAYELGRGIIVIYMGAEDMLEIYSIMVALEGMAARLAAENISPPKIEEMEGFLAKMAMALDNNDIAGFQKEHRVFNQTVFQATQNRRLFELLKRYEEYIVRTQSVAWLKNSERLKQEHGALLIAIKERNPDKAELIMRTHVEHSRQAYLEATKNQLD